jgi:hypothetical protein
MEKKNGFGVISTNFMNYINKRNRFWQWQWNKCDKK